MHIYREADADPTALEAQQVAILGYTSVGRAIALNLRDSGLDLLIGDQTDTARSQAAQDGFQLQRIDQAVRHSTIKLLCLPDEQLPELYQSNISPHIKNSDMLIFTSGYCLAFGFIEPPPFVDVGLFAPRTWGAGLRESYQYGRAFPSFIAIAHDYTNRAWPRLLAVAGAADGLRAGAVEISPRQEAELSLFTQQVVAPSIHNILTQCAELLIREGFPPDAVLLDLYASGELSYGLSKAAQFGLLNSLEAQGKLEQYGLLSRLDRFHDVKLQRQMELTLADIREARFAQEWSVEQASDYHRLNSYLDKRKALPLWRLESQLLHILRDIEREQQEILQADELDLSHQIPYGPLEDNTNLPATSIRPEDEP